jgi:hypothetical protein
MELTSVRDLAVVLLATVMFITTIVLVITALFVWRLIAAIRTDIAPILGTVRETADTVRETVDTVGDSVKESVRPSAGTIRLLQTFFRVTTGRKG